MLKEKEMRMKKLKDKYIKQEEENYKKNCIFQPNKTRQNLSKSLTFGQTENSLVYRSRESSIVSAKSANSFYERSINLKRIKEEKINKLREQKEN